LLYLMIMKNLAKNFIFILLIFLIISGVFTLFSQPFEKPKVLSLTQLVEEINQGKVKKITVSGQELQIIFEDGSKAKSRKEAETALSQSLINYGVEKEKLIKVEVETKKEEGIGIWLGPVLLFLLPLLLFGFFFWMIFRQAKVGAMQAFDFTKARARLFGAEGHPKEKITFKNVAGLAEAKEELKEVVDFLKNPKKFLQMGARIPRGVLLMGSPGTGKTLLARAVAGEAHVPFFHISGSEFVEMFVGVGASVTGDTPVLIKTGGSTKLISIGEWIDQFYKEGEEGLKNVKDVQTLGADFSKGNKFLKSSNWKKVKSVYRHKVNEIYEIQFVGGKIEVTGDHSIFVRDKNRIIIKRADKLRRGNILVNLPYKVRSVFIPGLGTTHKIKSHEFSQELKQEELPVWSENFQLERFQKAYEFALVNRGKISQYEIGREVGVSQSTIGFWQRGINQPRCFNMASRYKQKGIPQRVQITPSLLKLLGYYTAEGRKEEYYLQFVFGAYENESHQDCMNLMKEVFSINPHLKQTKDNTLRITYHSKFLGEFFEKHCGTGSHNKHIPEILWDLPKEYFLAYLEGFTKGDGYTDNLGRLCASSVSKQLITELIWLSSMHGIQASVKKSTTKEGRIINKKPLLVSTYWTIKFGKTSHPFIKTTSPIAQIKKPIIKKIIKKPYTGYVYDLCGCENEAFFGGEKPILLHNSRVRNLFSTAKKAAPAIIFIDELDAIGRHRGAGLGGGHDEREQTLNQILVEMDGFERDTNVIVVAATNRPDVLDPALLRPGRFDRRVVLDLPDVNDREEILKIHCQGKPLALNVKLREIAERTPGFSGADLANVVNEAAILAARKNKQQIFQEELLESIEKVLLGPERKSHILSKKEKEIAAFHEAGHALVSASLPESEPVRKISIVSRGVAAGYTIKMPKEEKKIKTKSEFLAELATLLGGYCAEKLKFGELTTGAANDLEKASQLARKLVKEYGMSSLGPISFGEKEELVFLGKELGEQRNYSEKVAAQIDKEVGKFIKEAEKKARKILVKKRKLLEEIAQTLIEKETIERKEFEDLIKLSKKISKEQKEKKPKKRERIARLKIKQV